MSWKQLFLLNLLLTLWKDCNSQEDNYFWHVLNKFPQSPLVDSPNLNNIDEQLVHKAPYIKQTVPSEYAENFEKFGMTEQEIDWMKKAVFAYRKEMARRQGYNVTNERISTSLKFGDLMFSREQLVYMLGKLGIDTHMRRKRKIVNFYNFPNRKWAMPIKYVLSSNFTDAEIAVIDSAVMELMRQTCLRFEKHNVTEIITTQHIHFYREVDGCWAYLGQRDVIPHAINLESPGCLNFWGVPIHEIGHALGLYHEQSRHDRDNYVTIIWDNIMPSNAYNFDKASTYEAQTFDIPYDYGSVMHYSAMAFQKAANLYTVLPNDTAQISILGQPTELAFYDSQIINAAYCNDVCSTKLCCQNGGYTDPKNCSTCRCIDGWGGILCNQIASGSSGCSPLSSALLVTQDVQFVQSENYTFHSTSPYHGPFEKGSSCFWLLQAPFNNSIKLWFEPWVGLMRGTDGSCFNWVEIRYKKSHVTRGIRICGYGKPIYNETNPIISEGNDVFISFRSPPFSSIIDFEDTYFQGFQLNFQLNSDPPKYNERLFSGSNSSNSCELTTNKDELTSTITTATTPSTTNASSSINLITTAPSTTNASSSINLITTAPSTSLSTATEYNSELSTDASTTTIVRNSQILARQASTISLAGSMFVAMALSHFL